MLKIYWGVNSCINPVKYSLFGLHLNGGFMESERSEGSAKDPKCVLWPRKESFMV